MNWSVRSRIVGGISLVLIAFITSRLLLYLHQVKVYVKKTETEMLNVREIVKDVKEVLPKPGRVMVPPEITPERICSAYRDKNRTSLEADFATKHYVGKWMRLSAKVDDV